MRIVDAITKGATGGYILNGLRPPYGPYNREPIVVQTFDEVIELLRRASMVEEEKVSVGRS